MLYCLLYDLLRVLVEILIVRGRGEAQLRAEVLALRHQLGVLERQVGRPRWQPADRILLAAISRALPRARPPYLAERVVLDVQAVDLGRMPGQYVSDILPGSRLLALAGHSRI